MVGIQGPPAPSIVSPDHWRKMNITCYRVNSDGRGALLWAAQRPPLTSHTPGNPPVFLPQAKTIFVTS
eukprot:2340415-Prymnesium_polylepis.1